MLPDAMKIIDQHSTEQARLQEQTVLQVEDRSRPAQEVLADQRESRTEDGAPALFVP